MTSVPAASDSPDQDPEPPPDRTVADLTLRFPYSAQTGQVGLLLFPTDLLDQIASRRTGLAGLPYIDAIPEAGNPPAIVIDSLVQLKRKGDPYGGGFGQGHTLRNSRSIAAFRYQGQHCEREGQHTSLLTTLKSDSGARLEHRLSWFDGDAAVEVSTTFFNDSDVAVTLEMLSSFALGGITPFDAADAPGRLRVHRFRSLWSAEARLETRSIEELHLERSWSGSGAFSERFGQIGTMPVRRWFPFLAVEDIRAGVCWGVQLVWAGSWQMEIYRQHDDVCLSGGLADREFGHWLKTLQPGESIVAPAATLSCVRGTLDDLCDRLTAVQQRALERQPQVEQDLPIACNEYCSSWGKPEQAQIVAMAGRLRDLGTTYLIIDAGWYKQEGRGWSDTHGDWIPSQQLFPAGLEATAAAIRARGQIPGLWFEMETVGSSSTAFSLVDHLLQRDGQALTIGERRFWDLNDPWVIEYLTERVIDLLERCRFGYLKVDYNETLGLGSDHPDGFGEGLRQQVLGSYRFFDLIRQRLPNLVIENCASGGHRLEPSMLARTAMSSFSDAHELVEIPIIAANLHRLLLPRQSQIWAVLHRSDSDRRLIYSLAATFLGRMCLSGEMEQLTDQQFNRVTQAVAFYRRIAPIIKHGKSRLSAHRGESWRHPTGWQANTRVGIDGTEISVVIHTFAAAPEELSLTLPAGSWRIEKTFPATLPVSLFESELRWPCPGEFNAGSLLLTRI